MEERVQINRQNRGVVWRQAMGHCGQEGKINGVPNNWNRRTQDAHPKIPTHKRREHHDTTTVGRIRVDIYKTKECNFWPVFVANRRQQKGETMEQFHSALRSLAQFCQLGTLEDRLLRDIFTANMNDPQLQKELLKVTLEPEKALELAISIELGARSQLAIQAKSTTDPSMVSIVGRSEPVLAVTSSMYRGNFRGNYNQPRGTFTQSRGNNDNNTQSNRQQVQHNCRNCGQPWTQDHRAKCQALGQTCRRCNKLNHLAKVCRSNFNINNNRNVNKIEEIHDTQHEDNINKVSLNNKIEHKRWLRRRLPCKPILPNGRINNPHQTKRDIWKQQILGNGWLRELKRLNHRADGPRDRGTGQKKLVESQDESN